MNKKQRNEINAFYDLYKSEKEGKMIYKFKCESCGKVFNVGICIKDYDRLKNRQTCPECGQKMKRVIEWQGIATSSNNNGWCGKSSGNAI